MLINPKDDYLSLALQIIELGLKLILWINMEKTGYKKS